MRRVTVLITLLLALGMTAGSASANQGKSADQGVSPTKLTNAGWFCFTERATHCLPDGDAVFSGNAVSSIILSFSADGEEFWGTELLIHRDHYNGQPCPQDEVTGGDGSYIDLSSEGLPYFVCHHFDSPLT